MEETGEKLLKVCRGVRRVGDFKERAQEKFDLAYRYITKIPVHSSSFIKNLAHLTNVFT